LALLVPGTLPITLSQYISSIKLNGSYIKSRAERLEVSHPNPISVLEENLKENRPVIVGLFAKDNGGKSGHYVLVVGIVYTYSQVLLIISQYGCYEVVDYHGFFKTAEMNFNDAWKDGWDFYVEKWDFYFEEYHIPRQGNYPHVVAEINTSDDQLKKTERNKQKIIELFSGKVVDERSREYIENNFDKINFRYHKEPRVIYFEKLTCISPEESENDEAWLLFTPDGKNPCEEADNPLNVTGLSYVKDMKANSVIWLNTTVSFYETMKISLWELDTIFDYDDLLGRKEISRYDLLPRIGEFKFNAYGSNYTLHYRVQR
jgi:hypothetical protein